jgi:hypothetical protein
MRQNYPKQSIEQFGADLINSQDLDPVYTMLVGAELDPEHLKRWLFAYTFSYSAGVVSWLSERQGEDFWAAAATFATNVEPSPLGERWPRGRERRHFRGKRCELAMLEMKQRFGTPERAFEEFTLPNSDGRTLTCPQIMTRVQTLPIYGPWIGFKVADLVDRVMGIPVEFTMPDVTFFESPRKAAKQWAEVYAPGAKTGVQEACDYIAQHLGHMSAPPRFDRPINLAEIETVLCKWGSHMNFHYPVGIDTVELREALHPWASVSPTAHRLMEFVPKVPEGYVH